MELEGLEGALFDRRGDQPGDRRNPGRVEHRGQRAGPSTLLSEAGIERVEVLFPEKEDVGVTISQTLTKDHVKSQQDALIEIYRKQRPGDPPTLETATALFEGMFYDPEEVRFLEGGPAQVQHQART